MKLVYVRDAGGNLRERLESAVSAGPADRVDHEPWSEVLRRNRIGRVGFARQDRPVLLPVTYGVQEDGSIVFRSARGAKLWVAENERPEAAFEVDEPDPEVGGRLAVVVHGRLEPVLDLVDVGRLDRGSVDPWAEAAALGRWIRLVPERVETWRLPGS